MLIDPRQPIIFDSDAMPGHGTGSWQMFPFEDSDTRCVTPYATDRTSQIARIIVAFIISGIVVVGGINTLFF
jgi:hypothetical protein